ncbi:MAG: hypothetical protein QOE08_1612 [Thermoleophilaceae bacterium]|nr:hypothetical protein [Thermoleophilaceae bacterium]
MTVDQVRNVLRERISRGATLDELDTILRMTRGLGQRQRAVLWNEAMRYDPRRVTSRQVDAARSFLTRARAGRGDRAARPD